jgi:hypothetical protein
MPLALLTLAVGASPIGVTECVITGLLSQAGRRPAPAALAAAPDAGLTAGPGAVPAVASAVRSWSPRHAAVHPSPW